MAGRIPKSFIDDLIGRADIVEVIGKRVALKKAGREYKACCPFHNEKTPSFWVSPTKQFYHCFGCGVSGTAIGFLMEHDHLSFPEAVEELASQMGVDVPRETGPDTGKHASGDDLYALNARVSQLYCDWLREDARAIAYLKKRGLTGETAGHFAIGYAPDAWNAVLKKFPQDAGKRGLLDAGLIIERTGGRATGDDSGHYDRFRDRIMFPIRDARGRVIGFGGRVLDKGEPKYLNSPETPVFHKGRELYGLYEVRRANRNLPRLLIVEGYMDVVRLHQAGITYAAATLGTATTSDHLHRVFKLTSEVVFGFDGDGAGRKAAWRALENALPEARDGRQIKFLFLPEGHDPDSLVGEEGREKFEARLDAAIPLSTYLVDHLAAQVDLDHVDGRARLAELARPLLQKLPDGIYRELLIGRLAERVGMPAPRLTTLLGEAPTSPLQPKPARGRQSVARISTGKGSVVRQAIALLLNHPEAAALVTGSDQLEGIGLPGVPLLAELLQDLRERPAKTKAVVLERWRDRPEGIHLTKLAISDSLLDDPRDAARELQKDLESIIGEWQSRRTGELIEKDRLLGLSQPELLELNELLKVRGPPATKNPRV